MKRTATTCLLVLLLAAAGCEPEPPAEPVDDETPESTLEPVFAPAAAASLERGLATVLEDVEAAGESLPDDPEAAAQAVESARSRVQRLTQYDLPLLRAQERSFDAIRHLRSGDVEAALAELDAIQEILQGLTGADVVPPEAMQRTLRLWTDARLAVESEAPKAPASLEELGGRLHNMRIKGGLALPRETSEEPEGSETEGETSESN